MHLVALVFFGAAVVIFCLLLLFVVFFFVYRLTSRETMAQLGFRSIVEMIGRVDKLEINPDVLHYKSRGLDLSALLTPATSLNENHSGVTKNFEQVRFFCWCLLGYVVVWPSCYVVFFLILCYLVSLSAHPVLVYVILWSPIPLLPCPCNSVV